MSTPMLTITRNRRGLMEIDVDDKPLIDGKTGKIAEFNYEETQLAIKGNLTRVGYVLRYLSETADGRVDVQIVGDI